MGWVCAARRSNSRARRSAPFQLGITAATWYMCQSARSFPRASVEALPHEEKKIVEPVAPWVQFNLARARRVLDRNLGESHARVFQRLNLDFFGERHAVRNEAHVFQDGAAEDPHAG